MHGDNLLRLISDTELKRIIEKYPPYKSPTSWASAMANTVSISFIKWLTDEATKRNIQYSFKVTNNET